VHALELDQIEERRADLDRDQRTGRAVRQLDDAVERRRREGFDELVQVQLIAAAEVGDRVGAKEVAALLHVFDEPVEGVVASAASIGVGAAHAAERIVASAAIEEVGRFSALEIVVEIRADEFFDAIDPIAGETENGLFASIDIHGAG
jgi:hypothetical protein